MSNRLLATTATVGVLGAGACYALWKWLRVEKIPTEWQKVGNLSDMMCFPIKSCGVIRLHEMECTDLGLKSGYLRDRDFMIVNENGNFISARVYPKMILIKPRVSNEIMSLDAPEMETLSINLKEIMSSKGSAKCTLFGKSVSCIDCGNEAAEWVSRFILKTDHGLRLMHYPQDSNNMRRSRMLSLVDDTDSGAFPDLTAYLLINQASVDDLNARMTNTIVDPQRFRSNLVVQGPLPLVEDDWRWVKIGDVVFKVAKLCTRCILTTVDHKSGEKDVNTEPLTTLKKYRLLEKLTPTYPKIEKSPVMGIHLVLRQPGTVHIRDPVYVSY